jgi:peptide/nickel transport system ATP-binding protein
VPLLTVEDLTTHIVLPGRTVRAVDGVSFTVEPGETVGLVGESGCGKTMTAASITRLLPEGGRVMGGRVVLDGRDLTAMREADMRLVRGREIGVVFQDPMTSLNPTQPIGRQVAEPLLIHGLAEGAEARKRAVELLDLVGIPRPSERVDSYPHQLSGGLRQRVVMAIALACDPKLLIADEPTTALDVSIQDQILALLERLKRELQMSVLLITHDMGVIAGHTDRVMVMYAGQIVESASNHELFSRTRHRYTEALLASLPQVNQDRREPLQTIPGVPPDLSRPLEFCRFAPRCAHRQDRCVSETPVLTAEAPTHAHACFFPRDEIRPPTYTAAVETAQVDNAREPEPLLTLDHVVKEYDVRASAFGRKLGVVHAVSDVSLQIFRGETFGLVGESGCGKTTIGRLSVGLERPTAGTVTFDGVDVGRIRGRGSERERRRQLQMIFQDPYASLDPRMRVGSILAEPMVVQRTHTRAERQERIVELLREVGLPGDATNAFPRQFSGGQRQRIGFARALALDPRLVVADEPVSALDISIRSQLLNLMQRLQRHHDLTYLMISHDLSVVRYLADRVGVMYLGKLVELGPTAAVYDTPAHPFTAGLIDAVPVADPAIARAKRASVAVRGELPSAVAPPSGCRFRTRCPRAQEICAEVEPALEPMTGPTHVAACHFPLQLPVEPAAAPGHFV